MNISKIQTTPNFYNTQKPQKREFIDIISDNVRNPRDVNDCVAVPRGIFKAYIYLMAGSGFNFYCKLFTAEMERNKKLHLMF